jgi:hypothetical protein
MVTRCAEWGGHGLWYGVQVREVHTVAHTRTGMSLVSPLTCASTSVSNTTPSSDSRVTAPGTRVTLGRVSAGR